MQRIEENVRNQIAQFLLAALAKAISSYKRHTSRPEEEGDKEFKDRHAASKVGISHIKVLVDLAKIANLPEKASAVSQDELAELINIAQGEVDTFEKG